MLRTSLRSVRALGSRPVAAVAGRQWQAAVVRPVVLGQRYYADEKKPISDAAKPAAIPTSETTTSPSTAPPPAPETVPSASISPEQAPLTPPPPPAPAATVAASTPPPPPPPKKKGFFRRLRNYVLTLTILGALAFGGGVWYSRINDSFHDFFTAFVPYGEQAVLYFEEIDFRKRFPNVANRVTGRPRETGEQVKIPAQSGASWRVADGAEPVGRQSSAVSKSVAAARDAVKPKKEPETVVEAKKETAELPTTEAKSSASKKAAIKKSAEKAAEKVTPAKVAAVPAAAATPEFKAPEVNEPSRWPPASPIDPMAVNGAKEPIVQEIVRMLNDIITVVNADGAAEKYGQTIGKAKNEVNKVASKLDAIKKAAEQEAAKQVKTRVDAFDEAANELISRVEGAMATQEAEWRKEFDAEMKKLKESYDDKVNVILQRERQINEERVNNKLLEQAIELQRQFARDIKDHVEKERDGRLGKLQELSSSVADLEKLTAGWNEVVDRNLKTQQLHVAVKAVQASLEDTQHPRPFVKELVALKEIAAGDDVVDAAIASINPTSYQRGISTKPELIDRFRRVATEVRKASLLPEEAGVASHASSYVLSKVLFKKQGLAAGDDVESVLTRTQTYLEEGDLDNAAREMNGLTGWARTLGRDWLGEVRKVLEVQQALDVIQTEARLQSLKVE